MPLDALLHGHAGRVEQIEAGRRLHPATGRRSTTRTARMSGGRASTEYPDYRELGEIASRSPRVDQCERALPTWSSRALVPPRDVHS